MIYLSTALLAMFITIASVPVFRRLAVRLRAVDLPEARKVHTEPIPRTGGLAMAIGALAPVFLWGPSDASVHAVMVGAGIVALFGFLDDTRDLDFRVKFAGQILAAAVAVEWGGVEIRDLGSLAPHGFVLPRWLAVPLTGFVIVGVTNAVNLSDGLDGLAGGISALCFCCIGYLAHQGGSPETAFLAVAVIGALVGFLRFNTHPATVFMGDTGSQLLGFLAITLSLGATQGPAEYAPLLPLLLVGFPVLDTLTVMAGRVAEGRSPFSADTNHFHHKLLRLGFSHADAVLFIYALQACLAVTALTLRHSSDWVVLGLYLCISAALVYGFYRGEKTGWRLNPEGIFHEAVVGKIRGFKRRQVLVKVAFPALQFCVPAVLLLSSILPEEIPLVYGLLAAVLAAAVLASTIARRSLRERTLRLAVYLLAPALVYLGTAAAGYEPEPSLLQAQDFATAALVVLALIVVKFSSREAFKGTTMDFLILSVALVVPNLQGVSRGMALAAAKVIVLFYSYDVLVAELRGELGWISGATAAVLAITAARGFMP